MWPLVHGVNASAPRSNPQGHVGTLAVESGGFRGILGKKLCNLFILSYDTLWVSTAPRSCVLGETSAARAGGSKRQCPGSWNENGRYVPCTMALYVCLDNTTPVNIPTYVEAIEQYDADNSK